MYIIMAKAVVQLKTGDKRMCKEKVGRSIGGLDMRRGKGSISWPWHVLVQDCDYID